MPPAENRVVLNHSGRLIALILLMLLYAPIPSTTQDNNIIKTQKPTNTDPSPSATIHDLNLKKDRLQNSVDRWNRLYIVGLFLTVVVVVLTGLAQFKTITFSRQLVDLQSQIERETDRQLRIELAGRDEKIAELHRAAGEANKVAGAANERAAVLEKQAAQLSADAERARSEIAAAQSEAAKASERAADSNRKAEEERIARVELQRLVSWRTIEPAHQQDAASRLNRFVGIRVGITFNAGDPEGYAFASQIASMIQFAGWEVVAFAPQASLGQTRTGIHVTTTGDSNSIRASDALVAEFAKMGFDALRSPEIDPRQTDPQKRPLVYVVVELKPQIGRK
jgi:hypothetical protein